jgi:hypothetical protein
MAPARSVGEVLASFVGFSVRAHAALQLLEALESDVVSAQTAHAYAPTEVYSAERSAELSSAAVSLLEAQERLCIAAATITKMTGFPPSLGG